MDMIVQLFLRHLVAFDHLFQIISEEEYARLFLIEPRMGRLGSGVRSSPIRENESLELEIFLKNISQQVLVLARVVAIHSVVRAHDSAGV